MRPSFRRKHVWLRLLGFGHRRIAGSIFPVGEEGGQSIRSGFGIVIDLGRLAVGCAQRLGQPTRAGEQSLCLLGHIGLLQVVDELSGCFALGLPHRLQHARLRDPAEIVVDGRRPAGRRHVEIDRTGQNVGMSEATRIAVPRLMHGIQAERGAMCEQRRLAVAIERRQRVPEFAVILWKLLYPLLMAGLDRFAEALSASPGACVLKLALLAETSRQVPDDIR